MSIRMLVATHKRANMPPDDFYLPVHVGHALNPIDLGHQSDNEGETISSLDASYSELTALFWASTTEALLECPIHFQFRWMHKPKPGHEALRT